jgi:hypothetical protein
MAENIQRNRGRPQNYKFDRGGTPAEMGPYIGIVVNNIDNTRSGRLQVYIEEFGSVKEDGLPTLDDPTLWRTVSYCPPFYGSTAQSGTNVGYGTYPGNRNSYGMWFTPPDLGVSVLCFFVGGDPTQGYYVGCIPEPGINHMIPAIGSAANYVAGNPTQENYFTNTTLLPVTELNEKNQAINDSPKFYNAPKPVQSVVAGILFQQGLDRDPVRGPIRSTSQRESPSNVYGISTPGKPIYQGGLDPKTIQSQLNSGSVKIQDIAVVGRQGGHTFVMDDGDLTGQDALVRIRTAKGHQITMSDDGDCFYITHANGQTWIELGKAGTVDVFSTNSVNIRTQGTLNFHADQDINMFAGGSIRLKAKSALRLEGDAAVGIYSDTRIAMYSKTSLSMRSDGTLALQSKTGSWNGGGSLNFVAKVINLNSGGALPTTPVQSMTGYKLADTVFVANQGWTPEPGQLETIVTRAPTHEPYPYHGRGVSTTANLNGSASLSDTSVGNAASTNASASTLAPIKQRSDQSVTQISQLSIQKPMTAADFLTEPVSTVAIPISRTGTPVTGSVVRDREGNPIKTRDGVLTSRL